MTEPTENESEELSTDELKSVSGGVCIPNDTYTNAPWDVGMDTDGDGFRKSPQGSGYGGSLDDYNKRVGLDTGPINKKEVGPTGREL